MESIVLDLFIIGILIYSLKLIRKLISNTESLAKFTIQIYKTNNPEPEDVTSAPPAPEIDGTPAGSGGEEGEETETAPAPGPEKDGDPAGEPPAPGPDKDSKKPAKKPAKKPVRKKGNTTKNEHKTNRRAEKSSQTEAVAKIAEGTK